MVARGEVWWGTAPEHGRRPYVVLTRSEAIGVLNKVLVAPLTTTVRRIPTEVSLDRTEGLPRTCVVSLDNLVMVPPAVMTERVTTLGPDKMQEVCQALGAATSCTAP